MIIVSVHVLYFGTWVFSGILRYTWVCLCIVRYIWVYLGILSHPLVYIGLQFDFEKFSGGWRRRLYNWRRRLYKKSDYSVCPRPLRWVFGFQVLVSGFLGFQFLGFRFTSDGTGRGARQLPNNCHCQKNRLKQSLKLN